jgi:phosphopantothenoylcysteine decarboxylase
VSRETGNRTSFPSGFTFFMMGVMNAEAGSILAGKTVVLGVTGSIAAYRAADLTSELVRLGAVVFPVLTENAARLVSPLTLQTLARNPVVTDLWEEGQGWQPGHIDLADRADILVVAPATAHTLACFAHGLAPNALTSIYLATRAPVLIAPAMNGKMLEHEATRANLEQLRKRGHRLVDTQTGMLACGYEGNGKLAAVEVIRDAIIEVLGQSRK